MRYNGKCSFFPDILIDIIIVLSDYVYMAILNIIPIKINAIFTNGYESIIKQIRKHN